MKFLRHLFIWDFSSPTNTGREGEYDVARILSRLKKGNYIVYNDIYLEQNGHTTQIDHIVLSIYGIFVIETKNYKGWIFGNDRAQYWTQTLYKKKYKIYNPVIQNWSHVNFLKRMSTQLKHATYFPIVVFSGEAILKEIESSVPVLVKRELLRKIERASEVYITHAQLREFDHQISQHIATGKKIRNQHQKNVRENIERKKSSNPGFGVCPKCGSRTVVKHGQYGEFYGCSGYPKCKYTKSKG